MKFKSWPVTLEDGDIVLNPFSYHDRQEWVKTHESNQNWLASWDATAPFPESGPRSFYDMVKQANQQAKRGIALPFALRVRRPEVHASLKLVGQVGVSNITYGSLCSGAIGYWISQEYAGRGIVPHAVVMVVEYCFTALRLHRLEVNIRPENKPSLRVVEKLGFREEGCRKRYIHIGGEWADHRTFAMTVEELPEEIFNRYRGW